MKNILKHGLEELELDPAAVDPLWNYLELLLDKNQVMDLTAITDPVDAVRLHLLDSLCLAHFITGPSLVDVGSGGGLPGLPLAIVRPDVHCTLLDSNGKRVDFLQNTVDKLGLRNVSCVQVRAEEFAANNRESFHFAVSRAVAALPTLCELCLPLISIGGRFLAMKSCHSDDEIHRSLHAIKILGGQPPQIFDYQIPTTSISHRTVSITKSSPTPKKYPRRFAQIKKQPL